MGLREWSLGGVLLSPFLLNDSLPMMFTGLVRLGLARVGLARWIWHEALFDCALYVCVLAALVALTGHW